MTSLREQVGTSIDRSTLEESRDFNTALLANTIGQLNPTPLEEYYMGGSIRSLTATLGSKVGVHVKHEDTLKLLKKAGARAEEASGRVRFPAAMVQELLGLASPVVTETGINGKILQAGAENLYYLVPSELNRNKRGDSIRKGCPGKPPLQTSERRLHLYHFFASSRCNSDIACIIISHPLEIKS